MGSNNQINIFKITKRDQKKFDHSNPRYDCDQNVDEENSSRQYRHLSKFPSWIVGRKRPGDGGNGWDKWPDLLLYFELITYNLGNSILIRIGSLKEFLEKKLGFKSSNHNKSVFTCGLNAWLILKIVSRSFVTKASMVCAQFRLAFSSIRLFVRSLPSMTCSWIKGWSDDSMHTLIKETLYSKLVLISFNASFRWPA